MSDNNNLPKQQTAVDWLEEALAENLKQIIVNSDSALMESLFSKAKAIQREQHKTSYKKGAIFNAYSYHLLNGRGKWGNLPQAFNEYYNETYGGSNE